MGKESNVLEGTGVTLDQYVAMTTKARDVRDHPAVAAAIEEAMRFATFAGRINPDGQDANELFGRIQTAISMAVVVMHAEQIGKTVEDFSLGRAPKHVHDRVLQVMNDEVCVGPNNIVRSAEIKVEGFGDDPLSGMPDPKTVSEEEFVEKLTDAFAKTLGMDEGAQLPPFMAQIVHERGVALYASMRNRAE